MPFVLGLVFLCLIHWVEPSTENQDFSGPLWYPSNIFRFTRPPTVSRSSISRPVPLVYGPSIQSTQRPFNPFIRIDLQNTDAFIPMFVPTTTIPATTIPATTIPATRIPATTTTTAPTTSTPTPTTSIPATISLTPVSTTSTSTYATTPVTTTLTPTYATTSATTTLTPQYATTLSSQLIKVCNSSTAPPCADKRFGFCMSDDDYPDDDVKLAAEFSELANDFSSKSIGDDEWISLLINSINNTGCVTSSMIAKPLRARNIDGDWRVIVQGARDIYQWQHMTLCGNQRGSCHNSERISPVFCFKGKCRQMFIVRQLLVFDPCNPDRQVFVDSFKLPSECSCRLSRTPCVYKYNV